MKDKEKAIDEALKRLDREQIAKNIEKENQEFNWALKRLSREQTANFIWIAAARATPFLTKDFLKAASCNGYLTLLFLSMETCRSLCTLRSFSNTNTIAIARDLAANLETARERVRELNLALDHSFALDLSHAINRAITTALSISRNFAYDLIPDRARDSAIDLLGITRYFDNKRSQEYFDLLIEDALLLCENRNGELNNDTSWYGEAWDEWLGVLRELDGEYWADWYIRLFENRFEVIDEEEVRRHLTLPIELWDKDLSVSAQWLMKLALPGHTNKNLNEARIILLGEKGAGKTSLARRLIDPKVPLPEKEESTEGVDITSVKLSEMAPGIPADRDANVHIWDFAGHAITHAAHRFFLSERCLYIIVYDGRTEGRNRLGYWLDHVRNYGGNSRIIVFVNLQDEHNPEIPETYFKDRYLDNKCEFVRFSIKDDAAKLQSFREKLTTIIAADPAWDQKIPTDYHDVKQQIEKVFVNEHKNHITRQEYDNISGSIAINEREGLLKSLTCLGVCLWYPEIEGIDLLVLNPEWITRGIYRIINWLKENGRTNACISLEELKQVFSNLEEDYPHDKHRFLYQLMQKYELAYKKAYCDEIVVPQCLPEDRPERIKLPIFSQEASLYVEITANKSGTEGPRLTFPPDVLPRFIVRRSEDLKNCLIWRYGAMIKKGNVTALIEQEEYSIRLRVKGSERRDYLGELLYTLTAVLNDYPSFASEKPEVSCCIIGNDGSSEMIPLIQVINYVQYMEKENKNSYFDPGRRMEIPLDNAKMYINPRVSNYLINAGKVIVAPEGTVNDMQNNGINVDELIHLINNLKAAIPKESDEDVKKIINENVAAIEEEFHKKKPSKVVINALLKVLQAIKGTAQFAAAVAAIINFVGTL